MRIYLNKIFLVIYEHFFSLLLFFIFENLNTRYMRN